MKHEVEPTSTISDREQPGSILGRLVTKITHRSRSGQPRPADIIDPADELDRGDFTHYPFTQHGEITTDEYNPSEMDLIAGDTPAERAERAAYLFGELMYAVEMEHLHGDIVTVASDQELQDFLEAARLHQSSGEFQPPPDAEFAALQREFPEVT